jgi:hypothetical protein
MVSTRPMPPPRLVTLVLCRRDGTVLGALSPFEVTVPWWQEVGPIVEGARSEHGIDVTVLRLLAAGANEFSAGGPVAYLAEVDAPIDLSLQPWTGDPNAEEELRSSWARPGGPAADLAWADAALAEGGSRRTGPAQQVRSWNLSSLWRLPTAEGAAWLKVVPPFFAHESAVLSRLDPELVPKVLAASGPRLLLAEEPGEDQYEAAAPAQLHMIGMLVTLQVQWMGRTDELLAVGAPDWRASALEAPLADLVRRSADDLDLGVVTRLNALLADLPARFVRIADCGLSDTLVHGDFHRGNVRGTGDDLVLLDWGDSGVGHPMLDQAAFLDRLPDDDRAAVRAEWSRRWRAAVPGCDPDGAAALLAPVAALRQALIYRVFLDGIEPTERIYHAHDPVIWLNRAAALAAAAAMPV